MIKPMIISYIADSWFNTKGKVLTKHQMKHLESLSEPELLSIMQGFSFAQVLSLPIEEIVKLQAKMDINSAILGMPQ